MSINPHDAGIPVLTEVIQDPAPVATPTAKPVPAAKPAIQAAPAEPENMDVSAAAPMDEERWERIEREVSERVLNQIMERIDAMLEERVRDSLADVLQTAIESLAAEIRNGLQHSIREVVIRSTALEIAKLQSTKN